MTLTHVLTPLTLGQVTIPNRVVRTAHHTGFAGAGGSDAMITYHVERAKGGCGLTILEATAVHPSSRLRHGPGLFQPSIIDEFHELMAAVSPHGMIVFQQLWHGGHLVPGFDGGPPLAVSAIPGHSGTVGRPATRAEIAEIVEAFGQAALNCRRGGLHGVEIAAGHGYLLHQFMSAYYNDRTDEYGGDFDNRARIVLEVLAAVRRIAGADFVLGLRVSPSEAPGGVSEDDLIQLVARVEAEGLADYLNISYGDYYRPDATAGAMDKATGYELPLTARLGASTRLPRLVNGRFRTLEEADQAIREGSAEMVGMTRAHIADPALVRKTREGRADQVRPCIGCNQGCLGGVRRVGAIGCTVNPAVGLEASLSEDLIVTAAAPRKVLVVGGGPAGMEAARVAALAGHQVILAEAASRLGGAVNLASLAPRSRGLADIAVWLEQEIYRLGVDVRLSSYLEASDILAEQADAVIIATGSLPRMDGFQLADPGRSLAGHDLPHVHSAAGLLADPAIKVGASAVVLDTVGHMEGLAITEHLLSKGAEVTFVSHLAGFATFAQAAGRDGAIFEHLHNAGNLTVLLKHELVEIRPGECLLRPLYDLQNRRARALPADTVVMVTPNLPLRGLYDDLRDSHPDIVLIGDALSPRDLQVAIAEGHRAGRSVQVQGVRP